MNTDWDKYFFELQNRYYNYLVYRFEKEVAQAGDKEYAFAYKALGFTFATGNVTNAPYQKDLIEHFLHCYKISKGDAVSNTLIQVPHFRNQHLNPVRAAISDIELPDTASQSSNSKSIEETAHYKNWFYRLFGISVKTTHISKQTASISLGADTGKLINTTDEREIVKFLTNYFVIE
ncbi:MAG: hypothetical protein JKX76_02875, partial [Colwellia sp.]|nr:hypothetical protein [Colwellia sp.]